MNKIFRNNTVISRAADVEPIVQNEDENTYHLKLTP
jgi:hypothetical protein